MTYIAVMYTLCIIFVTVENLLVNLVLHTHLLRVAEYRILGKRRKKD